MNFYNIPENYDSELDNLEERINSFRQGHINEKELKAYRVPFGIYEQRKDKTYVIRVRCTGGAVTPKQLLSATETAEKYGESLLHLTTRQEIQIHNVDLVDIIPCLRQLRKAGLSTRGGGGNTVRNILTSYNSGVAEDETFDVLPYTKALTNRLIDTETSWNLPRKYKIALTNSGTANTNVFIQDLGFVAKIHNSVKGFKVFAAGGMGRKPQPGQLLYNFIPGNMIFIVAEAVKNVFSRYGNRRNKHAARLRFLWNSLGRERFTGLVEKEVKELSKDESMILTDQELDLKTKLNEVIQLEPLDRNGTQYEIWKSRFVVPQKQKGLYSAIMPVLNGTIQVEKIFRLCRFLMNFGEDTIRLTVEQNIHIRNIPETYLYNLYRTLNLCSDLTNDPVVFSRIMACAGADTCRLGICIPRGLSQEIYKRLKQSSLDLDAVDPLKINISGCSNSCAQHYLADIGFSGKAERTGQDLYPAYNIHAGAELSSESLRLGETAGSVSSFDLPDFLIDLLFEYTEVKDNYNTFQEYVRDTGAERIRSISEKYGPPPPFDESDKYYFDWSASDKFSISERGEGECSAGLFDLIEHDLEESKRLLSPVENDRPGQNSLNKAVTLTARALLITRGVEVKSEHTVLEEFKTHFITTGLVDKKYSDLIKKALKTETLHTKDASEFNESIRDLYNKMDDSLQFFQQNHHEKTSEKGSSPDNTELSHSAFKDLRGVACPMNFVKTKIELSKINISERLKILLDDGDPIKNVPASLKSEGHEVISQIPEGNWWSLIIRKGK